jgi:hypothetical protein
LPEHQSWTPEFPIFKSTPHPPAADIPSPAGSGERNLSAFFSFQSGFDNAEHHILGNMDWEPARGHPCRTPVQHVDPRGCSNTCPVPESLHQHLGRKAAQLTKWTRKLLAVAPASPPAGDCHLAVLQWNVLVLCMAPYRLHAAWMSQVLVPPASGPLCGLSLTLVLWG